MKTSEKRLLFLMLGIALIGGVVVCSDFYLTERDALRKQIEQHELDWLIIEDLFEERAMWEMRQNWLEANQPRMTSQIEAQDEIFKLASGDEVEGVEVTKRDFIASESDAFRRQVGVSIVAKGDLASIMTWIYELSRPDTFRVIRNLKIIPDKEVPENVIATFDLLRWYAPENI